MDTTPAPKIDTHPDSAIIDALGGTVAVATLCEIKPPSVSEWRRTGITKGFRKFLMLRRPDVFGPAPKQAERAA